MAELTNLERSELAARVAGMSDDAYKIEVLAQLRKINGTVADHERTLHGHREQVGLVAQVKEHTELVAQARTTLKVMKVFLPVLGVGQIVTAWLTVTGGSP